MRNFYLLIVLLFTASASKAQTSGFSGTGANYDVYNYQIWWRLSPDSASKGIKGIVTMKFKTVVANVSTITFDLRGGTAGAIGTMTIDDLRYHGASLTPSRSGNIVTVNLPSAIVAANTRDSITITYHGIPANTTGATTGLAKASDANAGNYYNTLSESYEDRDWWPCKADMQDKADTIDITVNVPYRTNNATLTSATDTFWVAANGTLVDSTIDVSGTQAQRNRTFKFLNRYPMASYLVSVAVARFTRYYRGTVPVGGFNVPVVYYLLAGKDNSALITAMDKATQLVVPFSQKFGDYGFKDPVRGGKHGFYEGLTGAEGMEHQTFSAISTSSNTDVDVMIHELMHQWFGDKVSFATWEDLWLAEGFAEYAPALARDIAPAVGYVSSAYSYRSGLRSSALAQQAPVRIPPSGITNSTNIWKSGNTSTAYGSSVYMRGAMVVSMLRTLAGDTKFFNIMKEYQTRATLQYKSATMDTLRQIFSDSLGQDMTRFFADNVVGTGYPSNSVTYRQIYGARDSVYFKVSSQSRTNSSISYMQQPIVVHMKKTTAPVKDTSVVFYDWGGGLYSTAGNGLGPKLSEAGFRLSFQPDTYLVDDSARTLSSGNSVSGLMVLDLKMISFTAKQHTGYTDAAMILDNNTAASDVILERSGDGINFKDLGRMVMQASANSQKKYLFNDMSPLQNDNYYRGKYKGADGNYIYSGIVKLSNIVTRDFTILNNPVQDLLQIKTGTAAGKDISFTVYDASSKMILNKQVKNAPYITDINLPFLTSGIYILKIGAANEETKVLRFIVK